MGTIPAKNGSIDFETSNSFLANRLVEASLYYDSKVVPTVVNLINYL